MRIGYPVDLAVRKWPHFCRYGRAFGRSGGRCNGMGWVKLLTQLFSQVVRLLDNTSHPAHTRRHLHKSGLSTTLPSRPPIATTTALPHASQFNQLLHLSYSSRLLYNTKPASITRLLNRPSMPKPCCPCSWSSPYTSGLVV